MKIIKLFLTSVILSYSMTLYANIGTPPEGFVNTSEQVMNWEEVQKLLKNKSHIPILFSTMIPEDKNNQLYYAYGETIDTKVGQNYVIYFSTTQDCKGAKYCTVGSMRGEEGGKPENFRDRNNHVITQKIKLSKGITGYYTPAHAMGDYWPGMITWQCKKVLYTLSWNISVDKEKDALINMANVSIEEPKAICG